MTVQIENDRLYLRGRCGAEDAETLLLALQDQPDIPIDASGLVRLHLAVAQVLLARRPVLHAPPPSALLARIIFDFP